METFSIHLHGYGGQGLKSMIQEILAPLLAANGYNVQAFPFFGGERRGAKVAGYFRFGKEPITEHSIIDEPDMVVSFDERIPLMTITEGMREGGVILVNTASCPDNLLELVKKYKIFMVDARNIALKHGVGREEDSFMPTNTVMLGAILGVLELIINMDFSDEKVATAIAAALKAKTGENLAAFREGKSSVDMLVPEFTEESENPGLPKISQPNGLCTKCRVCYIFCPKRAIELGPDDVHIIHEDKCNSCGICVKICPRKAISVIFERRGA